VKSSYQVLCTPVQSTFSWKSFWKVKVPLRVAFVWTATLGKILTLDNLRKRYLIVIEWCCICKTCKESIYHLFLHCEVATEMWSAFFQLFCVVWVMPRRVSELLGSWRGKMSNRMSLHLWRRAPLCLMWCLWSSRMQAALTIVRMACSI
jgi:hypothetical protein